ncbi:MAG: HEAT repeat domain-containing protein [Myxococcota bacterium]|nr:HEAT repeat domain-containing protein [Myxococcota bacterium]
MVLYPIIVAAVVTRLAACGDRSKPATQIELGTVQWTGMDSQSSILSTEAFKSLAKEALADISAPGNRATEVKIAGHLETDEGNGALTLEAYADVAQLKIPVKAAVVATGSADSPSSVKDLVKKGLADLSRAVSNLLKLVDAPPDALVRALDSAEPDEQIFALHLIGQRRIPGAIKAIGRRLDDPRAPVAEAAAETLGLLGDASAVPLLIASIKRHNLRSEVRAIEAMGRIGGKEARAYLEMTATGHEIEEVRRLSEHLLKQLGQKNSHPDM